MGSKLPKPVKSTLLV